MKKRLSINKKGEAMDKNNILNEIREDLVSLVEKINYDNYDEILNKVEKYVMLIENINELPVLSDEEIYKSYYEEESIESLEAENRKISYHNRSINECLGKLRLKLQGGEIEDFGVYVPEKFIRINELDEGDWIKASPIFQYNFQPGRVKYRYEIVEKLEEPEETNRREVKYAEVKNDKILNTLYIDSTYKENLPLVITLSDYDVEKFSLVEGDIIDYRYWDPNVLQGKVVWRYEIDSEEEGLSLDEDGEI